MSEKTQDLTDVIRQQEDDFIEFALSGGVGVSSDEMIGSREFPIAAEKFPPSVFSEDIPLPAILAEVAVEKSVSPVFEKLASPKLPELSKEDRAKLLMQSPNRLFFYWSLGKNPFQTLNRALGSQAGSYSLVVKLINLKLDSEEIHFTDAEGSLWFDVDADTDYRAEIGFYAVNRPYIKLIHSNIVATPRKSPSPRSASAAEWTVSADKFSQVLDVAGFAQDAFDVALAGDDWNAAEAATQTAFARLIGKPKISVSGIGTEEIRFAMLALASGIPLEALRFRINPNLFAILQEHIESVSGEKALAALQEQFDFQTEDVWEEEIAPGVFGASLINFPRKLKKTRQMPKLAPVSSSNLTRFS